MAEKPVKKGQVSAPRYPIEELTANAEALFSVRPEVLAGALHNVEDKELSVAAAQRLVKQFLEKKVN